MQKISTENNFDKKPVIYVEKCSKFELNEWKMRKVCEKME